MPKISYFAKVLFWLVFWVTPCCYSKNLKSEISLNIYIVGQILNRKKLWPFKSRIVVRSSPIFDDFKYELGPES